MKRLIAYILLPLIFLASCSSTANNDYVTCNLYYYADEMHDSMAAKKITLEKAPTVDLVENLFTLLSSPESKKVFPILSPDIKLTEARINGRECILVLSPRYLEFPNQKRAEINACMTQTMCSLPDVERVTINCGESSFSFIADDFITDAPRTHHNMFTANLYFANETFDMLIKEERTISLESDKSLEHLVLSELLAGPSDINGKPLLSERIKINSVEVSEGICIIDLSSDFIAKTSYNEIPEKLAVYSIVNTMTELPMINSVKFLIDGKIGYGFESVDISKPLTNESNFSPR